MKSALITGINGFVGPYLTVQLAQRGFTVHGVDRWPSCSIRDVRYRALNILDATAMAAAMSEARPEEVYHLAGVSYLPDADASPSLALSINVMGAVSVLDAVKNTSPHARLLLIGSSKEYDNTGMSDSIAESTQPAPTDFYGVSKYAAELIGRQYGRQFGLDVRFTRSFNHTGVGQPPKFVCSDWAKQAAEIALDKKEPAITVGSLDAEIDFSDVRDIVSAYSAILEKGVPGEAYNVCSGRAVSLRYILDHLIARTGRLVDVQSVQKKVRSHTTSPRLVGDNRKLAEHTGWKPLIPLEQTLDELFDHWKAELSKSS